MSLLKNSKILQIFQVSQKKANKGGTDIFFWTPIILTSKPSFVISNLKLFYIITAFHSLPQPFPLFLRHGFCSESKNVEGNRVKRNVDI